MASELNRTELVILGMHNNLCRERIAEVLGRVDGVRDVNVSLLRARAIVLHEPPCKPADLVWAVVNSGYGAALSSPDVAARSA